jgi:Holliday junction DNA helicase RuvB
VSVTETETQFLAPAVRPEEDELRALAPPALARRVRRPGARQGAARDRARGDPLARRGARPPAADRPARARQDELAYIVREELGVGLRSAAGPALERKGDVAAILTGLGERDILFIDEIHRLNRAVEEILYPALEDFRLDIIVGQGPAARTLTLDLPPFTMIGATTRTGLLTTPLRDRFGMTFRLEHYEPDEARAHRATLGADPRRRDRRRGGRGDRAPLARDAADREPHPAPRPRRRRGAPPGRDHDRDRREALELLEVDERGLERTDRALLRAIVEKFDGGPVGLSTLAVALGEEPDTIEDVYEPYLLQLGFISERLAAGS